MKRKLKWIGVVLVVLVIGLGVVLFLLPRDRITVESWKQIRIGMTEKEVEGLLGASAMNGEEILGCRILKFESAAPRGRWMYEEITRRECLAV